MNLPKDLTFEFIEKKLKKEPNNAEAWKFKGDFLLEKFQIYEALQAYSKSLSIDQFYVEGWCGKGLASLFQNNIPEAIQCFDLCIFLSKQSNYEPFRLKSHAYTWNKYNQEKIKINLEKAYQINKSNISVLTSKAIFFKEYGLKNKSSELFKQILSQEPNNLVSKINLQKIEEYDSKKPLIDFLKTLDDFEDKDLYLEKLGNIFLLNFDLKSSGECFDYILEHFDQNLQILKKRALLHLMDNNFKNSLECLTEYLSKTSNDSDAWVRKGEILRRQNKTLESIECFDRAIEIDENNPEAWRRKAFAQRMRHVNLDQAIKCLDRSLEIDSFHPITLVQKSMFLGKSKPTWESAMHYLDEALEIDPTYVLAWKQKSELYSSTHLYDAAKICFENILKLEPDDAICWYNAGINDVKLAEYEFQQGVSLFNDKKLNEALKSFEKVLEIDPDDKESQSYKEQIIQILKK